MKYPQGYLFLNEKTTLPVLSTVQAWFTAKTEIYVPGLSPKSKLLDGRIEQLAGMHRHIWKRSDYQMKCIVFNDTRVSQTFMLAHTTDIKKVYWIDSAEQAKEIKTLGAVIRESQRFSSYVDQCGDIYSDLADYIFHKTGQTLVGDADIHRFITGRAWGSTSEAEIHIRQIAKNETRAGVLMRFDLEGQTAEVHDAAV